MSESWDQLQSVRCSTTRRSPEELKSGYLIRELMMTVLMRIEIVIIMIII